MHLRLGTISACREQLMENALAFMYQLATWSERVRSYFQHPAAQYAASPIEGLER
jgi:hypothetical protein